MAPPKVFGRRIADLAPKSKVERRRIADPKQMSAVLSEGAYQDSSPLMQTSRPYQCVAATLYRYIPAARTANSHDRARAAYVDCPWRAGRVRARIDPRPHERSPRPCLIHGCVGEDEAIEILQHRELGAADAIADRACLPVRMGGPASMPETRPHPAIVMARSSCTWRPMACGGNRRWMTPTVQPLAVRNVSTTLRQPAFEFKLGFPAFGLAG
jgi:hypothetical protein